MNRLELEQRRANVAAIAERRRAKTECGRGHSNWGWRRNGQRFCKTCKADRQRAARAQP